MWALSLQLLWMEIPAGLRASSQAARLTFQTNNRGRKRRSTVPGGGFIYTNSPIEQCFPFTGWSSKQGGFCEEQSSHHLMALATCKVGEAVSVCEPEEAATPAPPPSGPGGAGGSRPRMRLSSSTAHGQVGLRNGATM